MKLSSPKIVKSIREAARDRCELCDSKDSGHVHHEPSWGSTGQDTRLVLLYICWLCHAKRHNSPDLAKVIEARICRREKCKAEDRQMVIDLIWRAPKGSRPEWFWVEAAEWSASAKTLLGKTLAEAGVA